MGACELRRNRSYMTERRKRREGTKQMQKSLDTSSVTLELHLESLPWDCSFRSCQGLWSRGGHGQSSIPGPTGLLHKSYLQWPLDGILRISFNIGSSWRASYIQMYFHISLLDYDILTRSISDQSLGHGLIITGLRISSPGRWPQGGEQETTKGELRAMFEQEGNREVGKWVLSKCFWKVPHKHDWLLLALMQSLS